MKDAVSLASTRRRSPQLQSRLPDTPENDPGLETSLGSKETQILSLKKPKDISIAFPKALLLLLISASVALVAKLTSRGSDPFQQLDFEARARRILQTTPLIDGHNDLPFLFHLQLNNQIYDRGFSFKQGLGSHTDLQRMQEGGIGGQFWSTYVECPDIVHLDDPNHAVRNTLEQIDVVKRFIQEVPELAYCDTSQCARQAFKAGRIPSMIGTEGLHQVGSAIAVIRQFHDLGVRYITLTHNCDNAFATAASTVATTGKDNGLSKFGVEAIKEMNRLGVMVDLSHVSHQTMHDVLDVTQAPVIFSHTGCYSVGESFRNVPDSVLARLKENGGVVMVFFARRFIKPQDPDTATLKDVVDHIFHAAAMAGWDHVGLGSDFDGTGYLVDGLEDVSKYPALIEAILRRGATDEQVKKLVGENILRVWRQNELVSSVLKTRLKPVEAMWEGRSPPSFGGSLALPQLKPY